MEFIEAKQILSSRYSGDNWFGNNYGINIYKGCSHGCIYCDSRSDCYRVDNFSRVRSKKNVLQLLEQDLMSKRKTGIIGTGAMSDPYNPQERKYQLTRGALKLINQYKFGIGILTKSDLVVRDIDLFRQIKEHSPVVTKLTITTATDELCRKIEPNVAVTSKRFAALHQLSQAGLFTGVLLWPILPFINDDKNITAIVKSAAKNGAKFVAANFGVTLRQNQRAYFYQQLDKLFPGVRQKYVSTYGNSYDCRSPKEAELKTIFARECKRYGLLYKMTDIVQAIRNEYGKDKKQMSLFD